jgi:hypothetical protein
MNNEELFELFNSIPDPYRMLCIDSISVGCYLVQQGQSQAGMKLLHTALSAVGLDAKLAQEIIENLPDSLHALAMHTEIRALF